MNLTQMIRKKKASWGSGSRCSVGLWDWSLSYLMREEWKLLRDGMCGKFILSIRTALIWHVQVINTWLISTRYCPIDVSSSSALPAGPGLGRCWGTLPTWHLSHLSRYIRREPHLALTSTQTKLEQTDAQRDHCLPRWSLNWQMSRNHKKF